MNDELPTEERLRRIERGVQRRIDLRRVVARRVVGGAAAVLIVVGGAALLRPVVLSSSGGSSGSAARPAAGSAASSAEAAGSTPVTVRCHGAHEVTTHVDPAGLPASALTACALAERGAGVSAAHETTSATPAPGTLCRTTDGALHVYAGAPAVCATHGMTPFRP